MRNWISIVTEGYSETEKFWIDTKTGALETLPEDESFEHETALPGDGNLGFQEAIDAGWVRGGLKQDDHSRLYLQGRDLSAVRKALKRALHNYAPDEATLEWPNEFIQLNDLEEMDNFVKRGRLPRS